MKVEVTRQIDSSEVDQNGFYDWYYEYDIYEFFDNGSLKVRARSYTDESEEVSIMSIKGKEKIKSNDLGSPFLIKVLQHLIKNEKKEKIKYLGQSGYSLVQSKFIQQANET